MKTVAILALAEDRDGGAFYFAHVLRRRPTGSSAHGLPCMASRLRQRGAVLREALPTAPITSRRRIPAILGARHDTPVSCVAEDAGVMEQLRWY